MRKVSMRPTPSFSTPSHPRPPNFGTVHLICCEHQVLPSEVRHSVESLIAWFNVDVKLKGIYLDCKLKGTLTFRSFCQKSFKQHLFYTASTFLLVGLGTGRKWKKVGCSMLQLWLAPSRWVAELWPRLDEPRETVHLHDAMANDDMIKL